MKNTFITRDAGRALAFAFAFYAVSMSVCEARVVSQSNDGSFRYSAFATASVAMLTMDAPSVPAIAPVAAADVVVHSTAGSAANVQDTELQPGKLAPPASAATAFAGGFYADYCSINLNLI